eukprot:TRINITY_DN18793_c0_g1_i1.p1 TRINITY_DN18793_c0_g1~~TRINITY_DN18793_c0_g1_i1.p1  ORF type:complete len:417 (-),score=95.98 TRINITY_DN18793_c0_g1_i1:75-1325(-)
MGAFIPSTKLDAALGALATVGSIDLDSQLPLAPVLSCSQSGKEFRGPGLSTESFESGFDTRAGTLTLHLRFEDPNSSDAPEPMQIEQPAPTAPQPAPAAPVPDRTSQPGLPPATKPRPTLSMNILKERLRDFEEELGRERFVRSVGILVKYMKNIQRSSPHDPRPRTVSLQNKAFSEHIAKHRAGGLLFEALGWQLDDSTPLIYLRAEHPRFTVDSIQVLERAIAAPEREAALAPAIRASSMSNQSQVGGSSSAAASAHVLPEQPTLTELKLSKLRAEKLIPIPERELQGFNRQVRVMTVDQLSGAASAPPEVSEADFELRPGDVRGLLGGGGEKEVPGFKTKAWKELEQLEKMKTYEATVIRVRFPDQAVLEARFHPRERVEKLYQVVQSVLEGEPAGWGAVSYTHLTLPTKRIV